MIVMTLKTVSVSGGTWGIKMPQNINVMSGTCVTIPCFFDVASNHKINLDDTCKAYWSDSLPFNSENAKLKPTKDMTGDLTKKDCTTTFNNASLLQSTKYYFRLECDNALKYTFSQTGVNISSIDDPPSLTLTPSTLEVKEGTSVSLTCSAPAPCWSHPPALTWSPNLGQSQETLQEHQDKTKVKTSVLSFTASHLHHGNKISCTAVYQKQDGSPDVTAETSLTPDISSGTWGIKMPQNINVMSGTCVTIPCFFDVASNHKINLDDTCKAYWSDSLPFNSENAKLKPTKDMTGDLTKKDCTTTFNNASLLQSTKYYFRLECDNALKYTFSQTGVNISSIDDPPSLTLTPSTLEVKEGTSVSLTCSAPAPCWSHPPALTWSPNLGQSQETLQENQDKTKVKTSVMSFTASHLHHGNKISCTAVYQKQDGSPDVTAETSLTPDISSGTWGIKMPQNINVMSGTCVTIPCFFDVDRNHKINLDDSCKAYWSDSTSFNSENAKLKPTKDMTGDLTKKDCTTTFNNASLLQSTKYYFRLECDNALKYTFSQTGVNISSIAVPPSPTLTPSTLEVKEGTLVSLMCSAPAPCWSHPPALRWTPNRGQSWETLQEHQDKTKVKTSVMSFTASHLHHGNKISCTAVYRKQDGSPDVTAETSLIPVISYSPKDVRISVSPSGPIREQQKVTLTCSSNANPAVENYAWYRAGRNQETLIGTGRTLNVAVSTINSIFFCKATNKIGVKQSSNLQIDVQYSPKDVRISVSPSGPIVEHRKVTLTCSSNANPAVENYAWYRAGRNQETLIGTGRTLNVAVSTINSIFFCKATNKIGVEQSSNLQIDVQYSPKNITVSVSPSGPVPENSNMTLTCSSDANPAVRNYTWYRADGNQETFIGTGMSSSIKVSRDTQALFCKAENEIGVGRSRNMQIEVQYPPQILLSSHCSSTQSQLNCSYSEQDNSEELLHSESAS
uniref:Ig-like domain-containing protein n=1 Tax=Oreochromis niloticus TaxID=8128 RepID=A0A669F7Z6_ORENI